jgi:acetyl esterase/lipase
MAGVRKATRWGYSLGCLAAIVAALVVLSLAVGAALDSTRSYFATVSSSLWTTFGPHFVVLTLVATLLSLAGWRWGPPKLARFAAALSALALLAAAYIVGNIVTAAASAGAWINPIDGLWLGKMNVPPPDRTETVADVDGRALKAAIYLPREPGAPAPVFVYIHGGGFMIGTATETAADLRWFADRGWAVFSIDYRLFKPGNPTWDKAPVDVACGLAWVHANAARFGGDPQRIVLLGDSAGGNLALNLAYGAALGLVRSGCGAIPTPKAVVVQYPAVDPLAVYQRGYPVPGFEPRMLMEGYIGGTPAQHPDRLKAISTETYLSNKAPPTLVIEPENDGLVVSDSVYRFVDKARAAGVDIEMVRIPFANHIYNQLAANSIGNQARLGITDAYFKRRGLAPAASRRQSALTDGR